MTSRSTKFEAVKKELTKKFGSDAFSTNDLSIKRISTGSFLIDRAIGGGWPVGRIVELYGPPGCGKSTLALAACRESVAVDEPVLYLDYENAYSPEYASLLGIPYEHPLFALSQPNSLEFGIEMALQFLRNDAVGMIIVDSLAAMTPKRVLEADLEDEPRVAEQARMLARSFQLLDGEVSKSNAVMLLVNHTREALNIRGPGGFSPKTTPGGWATRFYTSIRLELKPSGAPIKGKIEDPITGKQEDGVVAFKIAATAVKNKTAVPYRSGIFYLRGGVGLSDYDTVFEILMSRGIIKKGGAGMHTLPALGPFEEVKVRAGYRVVPYLIENPDYFDVLRKLAIKILDREESEKSGSKPATTQITLEPETYESLTMNEDDPYSEDFESELDVRLFPMPSLSLESDDTNEIEDEEQEFESEESIVSDDAGMLPEDLPAELTEVA